MAISGKLIPIICRLVRTTGSRRLPRLLRSLAMTGLVVQFLPCHCEERSDVAISGQFVPVKRRLIPITGSLRLPRLLRSLAMTGLVYGNSLIQSSCRSFCRSVHVHPQAFRIWRRTWDGAAREAAGSESGSGSVCSSSAEAASPVRSQWLSPRR